jgi:hypothetical protein
MPTPLPTKRTTPAGARPAEEDESPRPYVIVSHIGKGSFATVYKGYHEVRASYVRSLARLRLSTYLYIGHPRPSRDKDYQAGRTLHEATRQLEERNRHLEEPVSPAYYEALGHRGMSEQYRTGFPI